MTTNPISSATLRLLRTGTQRPVLTQILEALAQNFTHWLGIAKLGLAGLVVSLLLLAATFPQLLSAADPLEADAQQAFLPGSADHWLGTDENGRDVYARAVFGTRSALFVGLGATAIGLGFGTLLGLVAGLSHRWIDELIMRAVDVILSFPDLLLALVIITFWGQGLVNAILAIGIASIPRYARLVRAQATAVRSAAYVEAARSLGLHPLVLVYRHIMPNAIKPVLVLATIGIGGKISAGASLSFLGFGSPPPAADWGAMLASGRNFFFNAPWLTEVPTLCIIITVMSLSILGKALRNHVEGRAL